LWLLSKEGCKQLRMQEIDELDKHYKDKIAEEASWAARFEKVGLSFL
jgi:hypothetical protein